MNSRETILQRIQEAAQAANLPQSEPPPVPEVWPETGADREAMLQRFAQELETVQGELVRCGSVDEARAKFAELAREDGWTSLGAMDRPPCRELADGLDAASVVWDPAEGDARQMADLSAGLVSADHLLADTGSCVVACLSASDRMLCYLPPVCVVTARVENLLEHMPALWEHIAPLAKEPERRGEHVIITGPSRTADIEKILILGVHGPKRLVVLLID